MFPEYSSGTDNGLIKMEDEGDERLDSTPTQLLMKISEELNRCWTIQLELFKCLDEKLSRLPDRIVYCLRDLLEKPKGCGKLSNDPFLSGRDRKRKIKQAPKKCYVTKYGRRTSVQYGYD